MLFKLSFSCFLYLITVLVTCSVPDVNHTTDGLANLTLCELDKASTKSNISKLSLTVFYESLCPTSVLFFKTQFAKNWIPFYDYLNVTLVPYGKAMQTRDEKGNWTFICQHGEDECYYNRIQVCAISKMIEDNIKFTFISCHMSDMEKEMRGPECARTANIEFSELENCAKSKEGFDMLAVHGEITHSFRPEIQWVPTIVLNNKFNQTENDLAISDLKSLLCEKLVLKPNICTT